MFPFFVQAEAKVNKDWFWDLSGSEYVYAATINPEKRILGQYCYFKDNGCYYLVTLGITCETGSEYPSILNSDAGVEEVRLICGHKKDGENVFFIKPFDKVDNLVKNAKTVGFAVAMNSSRFKVVRYSLSGSSYAIDKMRTGAEIINKSKPKTKKEVTSEQYL